MKSWLLDKESIQKKFLNQYDKTRADENAKSVAEITEIEAKKICKIQFEKGKEERTLEIVSFLERWMKQSKHGSNNSFREGDTISDFLFEIIEEIKEEFKYDGKENQAAPKQNSS